MGHTDGPCVGPRLRTKAISVSPKARQEVATLLRYSVTAQCREKSAPTSVSDCRNSHCRAANCTAAASDSRRALSDSLKRWFASPDKVSQRRCTTAKSARLCKRACLHPARPRSYLGGSRRARLPDKRDLASPHAAPPGPHQHHSAGSPPQRWPCTLPVSNGTEFERDRCQSVARRGARSPW